MPACPGGAQPKPENPTLQAWLDQNKLVAEVVTLIKRLSPLGWASIVPELVDIPSLCRDNLDPPDAFGELDFVRTSLALPLGGLAQDPVIINKAAQWLRYQLFLENCDCIGAPAPTPGMCPYTNATITVPSGANSPAIAYDIPQSIYDTWPVTGTLPNQDWKYVRQTTATQVPSGSNVLFIQWSADNSVWHFMEDLRTVNSLGPNCVATTLFIQPPRMPRTGFVRVHNNGVFTDTVGGFSWCFCGLTAAPPPLPPQPALPGVPDAPARTCTNDDICNAIAELSKRVTIIAKELQEVQRFGVPFAYIPGSQHVGLTGRGSFAIDRLLGMKVNITSHTTTHPDLEGNPSYIWDQGWMSVMTADGLIEEKRVSQTNMTWLPRLMDMGTTFGYELRPGTVATFTELHAEP